MLLMLVGGLIEAGDMVGVTLIAPGALLALIGLAASASRLVLASARLAGRRARSPETLLAARALEADPRAWGRTMAVVALVVAFGTGTGALRWDVFRDRAEYGVSLERFWVVSFTLTHLALLFALLVAVTAVVVHRAESLLESGRSTAALAATGVPVRALRQTLIAATPICAIAALAACVGMTGGVFTTRKNLLGFAWMAGQGLVMVVLAVAIASAVTALSGRLLTRAASPTRLRTD
ncbi:hypothetical protein GCM10010191_17660 [Actinomadura vinacea]|uniref:FtsX-like permease family protein n=1 Tax=Actinomadura vinacea TaxID=115336 RepID=A0ABP5VTT0_9ACTN